MSFAAFILKLEADSKGVEKGVNVAQAHFKRLGKTVKDIETRQQEQVKAATKMAYDRLKPEEKMVGLLRTREQIANRLARVEDPRTKNIYLQKQLEIEQKIAGARAAQAAASHSALRFGLAGRMGLAGAGAGVVLGAGAKAANEMQDQSLVTGLSIGGVEKLMVGADATGTSFSGLAGAARNVRSAQSAALNGNQKMLKAFGQAGVSGDDLRGMSSEDLFFKLAQGGANVGNVSALNKIFGEGGSDEVIKAFGNGLSDAAENINRFNIGMDESTVEALAEFKTGIQQATSVFKQVGRWGLNGLAGGFLALGKRAVGLFGTPDEMVDANAEANLIGDADYSASLAASKRLEGALELAKERRGHSDYMAEEGEWDYMDPVKKKKGRSRTSTMGSGNHIDTDELARIGLFRGGSSNTPVTERLDRIHRELQQIKQEVQEE